MSGIFDEVDKLLIKINVQIVDQKAFLNLQVIIQKHDEFLINFSEIFLAGGWGRKNLLGHTHAE